MSSDSFEKCIYKITLQFLPSSSRVDTAIWMNYTDAYKTYGEKA